MKSSECKRANFFSMGLTDSATGKCDTPKQISGHVLQTVQILLDRERKSGPEEPPFKIYVTYAEKKKSQILIAKKKKKRICFPSH